MEDYEFRSHWADMDTPPANATRCLVTDGEVVITATYLQHDDKSSVWVFQGLDTDKEKFSVIGWMPLPRPLKKAKQVEQVEIVIENESAPKNLAKD